MAERAATTRERLEPAEPMTVPEALRRRLEKDGLSVSFQPRSPSMRAQTVAGTRIVPATLTDSEKKELADRVEDGRLVFSDQVLCTERIAEREARIKREGMRGSGYLTPDEFNNKREEIVDQANSKIGRRGGVARNLTDSEIEVAGATPGNEVSTLEVMHQEREAQRARG